MVSWPVILGLIRSNDMLPQRVTSLGYHAVFATPPAEQEGGDAYLRLKSVPPQYQTFLKHALNPLDPLPYGQLRAGDPKNMQKNLESSGKLSIWCETGGPCTLIWQEDEVELIHNRR